MTPSPTKCERPAAQGAPVTDGERLRAAALFGAALFVCLPALATLPEAWRRVEFYAHGYLIALLVPWLLFTRRRSIQQALARRERAPLASLAAILAAATETVAVALDARFAAGLGVPLVLAATAWAVGGRRLVRELALPLVLLALMVPPPEAAVHAATIGLRAFVTGAAVGLLHLAGVAVAADGNTIILGDTHLFVADACSGLTSIVTLASLAALIAAFGVRGAWRRALVVASALPLALLLNLLRIVVTVLAASRIGAAAAEGAAHQVFGLVVYLGGTAVLLGLARWSRRAPAPALA